MVATSGMPVSADSRVHLRHHVPVLIQPVVLNLQKEIAAAEDVLILVRQPPRIVVSVLHQRLVDVALQARRQRDQALGVLRQQVFVHPRLVIEAFQDTPVDTSLIRFR